MLWPIRIILGAALAAASAVVPAQTVAPTLTVQQLAPQLQIFAGSPQNFQNLVNGLAQGTAVQLTSVLPEGFTQVVTFTPTAALAPADIARVLETARQQLIGLGIGNPTAEQIGITLMGGLVPTPVGGAQLAGLLAPTTPSPAVQAQASAAAGASLTNSVNVQLLPNVTPTVTPTVTPGVAATPRTNTSDSRLPSGATSRSPVIGNTSNSPLPATPPPTTPVTPTASAAAAPPGTATSGIAR